MSIFTQHFQRWMFRFAGITPLQVTSVSYAWGLRFLWQMGHVIAWTLLAAITVSHFGLTALPWFLGADALFVLLGTGLSLLILPHIRSKQFALLYTGLTVVIFTVAWLVFAHDSVAFLITMMAAKGLFFSQLNIFLYRESEKLFSPKEAKLVLPKIETAMTIGSIVGAGVSLMLLSVALPAFILWVWALATVGMCVLFSFRESITLRIPHLHPEPAPYTSAFTEAKTLLTRAPWARYMLAFVFLQGLLFLVIEYEFIRELYSHVLPKDPEGLAFSWQWLSGNLFETAKEVAVQALNSAAVTVEDVTSRILAHETLAHDLTTLHLIFGAFALGVQLVITPKVLTRLGVTRTIIGHGVLVGGSSVLMLLGYCSPSFLRLMQHSTHSLGEAPYHVSYYSLPTPGRESTRLVLEGFIRPAGALMALGLLAASGTTEVFVLAIVGMGGLFLLAPKLRQAYTKQCAQLLAHKDKVAHSIHAIELLGQNHQTDEAPAMLAKTLVTDSFHPCVRVSAARTLAEKYPCHSIAPMLEVIKDPETDREGLLLPLLDIIHHLTLPDVFAKQYHWSYYTLQEVLVELLSHKHAEVRKRAVLCLFQHMKSERIVPLFLKYMHTTDTRTQEILLRTCAEVKDPALVQYLRPFIHHASLRVRSHALIALWSVGAHHELESQLKLWLKSETPSTLIAGLYCAGEVKATHLASRLVRVLSHPEQRVRLHAALALAKLEDERAIRAIMDLLMHAKPEDARRIRRMMRRLPVFIRSQLETHIRLYVGTELRQLFVRTHHTLQTLSAQVLHRVKQLYTLAEKEDELASLQSFFERETSTKGSHVGRIH